MKDERVLFAAIAQGKIKDIVQSGVLKHTFQEPYDCILKACETIFVRGDNITLLSISAECQLSNEDWVEVRTVWRESKTSQMVSLKVSAERIIERNLVENGKRISDYIHSEIDINPREVKNTLSTALVQLQTAIDTGHSYNPTPSYHYRSGNIGQVMASSGYKDLDILLQGGLWTQALIINGMPSNHGKSTMSYSLIARAIHNKLKCVLFTFETSSATAVARVLSAYGCFKFADAVRRVGETPEETELMNEALQDIDKYLHIYDDKFNDVHKIETVIRVERPHLGVIDHLGMMGKEGANRFDTVGDIADASLQLTVDYNFTMFVNSQFSDEVSAEIKKKHDLQHTRLFGSSRVYNAADFVLIGLRHWLKPDVTYIRSKKNRKNGIIDLDCEIIHDPYTQAYIND